MGGAKNVRISLIVVLSEVYLNSTYRKFAKIQLGQVDVTNMQEKKGFNTWKTLAGMENGYVSNSEKREKHIIKHVEKHFRCQQH